MRRLLWIGFGIFVLWSLASTVTQVQPGERAVVRRFGKVLDDKPGPGLFIGLPWGLDRVDRVPVGRVRPVTIGLTGKDGDDDVNPPGQMLTGDHNLVNVQAEVYYKVEEDQVENFVLQAERVDVLIARAAETALTEWMANRSVDEILLQGKSRLPVWLKAKVQERIDDYRLGVHIEQASITHLNPPTEVRAYFDEVGQAQTKIRTQINQAEQDADRQRQQARAEKFQSERLTAAYAKSEHLKAQAEAENFLRRLTQYNQLVKADPNYLNVLWLDEMSRTFARMKDGGRLDILDNHLSEDGINITQFPLGSKKK